MSASRAAAADVLRKRGGFVAARLPRKSRETPGAPRADSPLVEFQLDVREVRQMAPHVLSAAVASAGKARHRSEALWKAYGERALTLARSGDLSLRDVRLLLQGHAEGSHRDHSLFQELVGRLPKRTADASPKDLCSIAVAMAKLTFKDASTFEQVASRVVDDIVEFEAIDVASLANAFARAAHCDSAIFGAVGAHLQTLARDSPERITPAAAALTLNAFGMCGYSESAHWESLVDAAVSRRLAEFTTTQVALILGALARQSGTLPLARARSIVDEAADHWISTGHFESVTCSPQDIAFLADSLVRLQATENEDLNNALTGAALRNLSTFSGSELVMLCGALRGLKCSGRGALLTMVAHHALPDVLHRSRGGCSLGDLGTLLETFARCNVNLPSLVADRLFLRVATEAEAAPAAARSAKGRSGSSGERRLETASETSESSLHEALSASELHIATMSDVSAATVSTSGSHVSALPLASSRCVAALADGAVRWPAPEIGLRAFLALKPLVFALADAKRLSPRAKAAVAAAQRHFGVADDLLAVLADEDGEAT
eukprot:TRINITY_DN37265_c0_g1_i1.p1 TRINITY_DN37265_c0_g1~~TRINITY_DN37265_c0_g1_i1.p1  ORF type:complete len:550 (-),score=109.19 TRINITY_DN37265_c0_g1_i1:153-1802(-)